MLDAVMGDVVTVTARAPGARHPECGSHPENPGLIKSATKWGGSRVGAGRKPASVVVGGDGPRWYCLEVHRRCERSVVAELVRMAFVAVAPEFLDTVPADVRRRQPAREVLRPAFPGYVLVEMDVADPRWRQVAHVRGARRVMGQGPERPSAIPVGQAAWLLAQFGEDGVQRRPRLGAKDAPLPADAWAEVVAGPFEGMRGRVNSSDGRAVVLMVAGRRVRLAQVAVRLAGPP